MAILPMHYIGRDPILRERARKVKDPTTPAMRKLAADMVESMHHYAGVGLAANQIGSLHRLAVIQLPEDDEPRILFNLEVTRKEGEREVTEGCLSLPGYRANILRAECVSARAIDGEGRPVRVKRAEGLLAQALEHEDDHLNGILYVDHLRSNDDLYEVEEGTEEDGEAEAGVEEVASAAG